MIYEIAGLRADVKNHCAYTTAFCKEYLAEDQTSPVDFSVEVTKEEFAAEKALSEGFSDGYIENICLYRKICLLAPKFNRFLLHSAVLTYEGNAYAFLGRSGIGKSTHTALWTKHVNGAEILNGDKPILSFEKNGEEREFIVHGTPWNGKENRGRKGCAPLKSLCFIERAKENSIERITPSQATDRIFSQVLLPTEQVAAEKTLSLLDKLVTCVPSYVLHCNMEINALETSFAALTGEILQGDRIKKQGEEGENNEN